MKVHVLKCYGLSVRAIEVAFHVHECPKGAIDCNLVLFNVHAYITRTIEKVTPLLVYKL